MAIQGKQGWARDFGHKPITQSKNLTPNPQQWELGEGRDYNCKTLIYTHSSELCNSIGYNIYIYLQILFHKLFTYKSNINIIYTI